jgi:hypothetical protein
MATELLFETFKKYIEPLLNFGWITINNQGFLVEREHGTALHFINDRFKGLPGESEVRYPVVPLSDEHYLSIKDSEDQEVFQPFTSIKHMQLVVLEFKRGLINYCLSDKVGDDVSISQQEDLIKFYYNAHGDKEFIVGFSNMEDVENPIDLYTAIAEDAIEAMWTLCVKAYNELDRKHEECFYTTDKTWRLIKRMTKKWEDQKYSILSKNKIEHQNDIGYQHMDLSDSAVEGIKDYSENYFVATASMNQYLLSLFQPHELKGGFTEGLEQVDLFEKERIYQLPDFASDEFLFAKARKVQPNVIVPKEDNAETITLIDNEYQYHSLTKDQFEKFKTEKPVFVEITDMETEDGEDKNTFMVENRDTEAVLSPMGVFENKIIPPIGKKLIYEDVALPNGETMKAVPHITDIAPPSSPLGTIRPKSPQSSSPQPFNPFFGMNSPQYPSPFGYGYPQFQYGMGPQNLQALPDNINQIDFESSDHPDPLSNYK